MQHPPIMGLDTSSPSTYQLSAVSSPTSSYLHVYKLTENATIPTKATTLAAGYDLYSAYNYTIPARGRHIILTDIQIRLPSKCYGRIAPRSGLAVNWAIDVGAGVIDADYRGNVAVVLFNHGCMDFHVVKGDRVAQLICERIYAPTIVIESNNMRLFSELRDCNGFGSTGR